LIQGCLFEASLSRGDFTETGWRVLKGLLPSNLRTVVEAGVPAVTLAEIMADSVHYSIDSTTLRAHVLAAGKKWLIDALLAARGMGSPISFTAWLIFLGDRSPST
jgi:hypothetical protein